MSRRKIRERALQSLYELEFHPQDEEQIITMGSQELPDSYQEYYFALTKGVCENRPSIDAVIEKYLKEGWSLGRISSVDRNILRIAVYELLFQSDTPAKAIVTEALEIAKRFSDLESSRFINGVLGQFLREAE